MATYINGGKMQVFKTNTVDYGVGFKLYTYESGTSTPRATYPTIDDAQAETNANAWPLVFNARGEATAAISGITDAILKDENDNLIWEVDQLDSSSDVTDADGNLLVHFITVPNAVNAFSITNAASGDSPVFAAYGTDTNIGLNLTSKGSGTLFLDGGATGGIQLGATSSGAIALKRNTTITGNTSGIGTLNITGATTLQSTLGVTGAVSCLSTLAVSTTSTLTGAVTAQASLSVATTSLLSGAVTASNTLQVAGATTLQSTVGVTGVLTIANNLVMSDTTKSFTLIPVGVIFATAGTVPSGWLLCDGSAVSRTTYAVLFAAISTTWGVGDGSTTFNVPDLRRRTLVGVGGASTGTLGNTVGSTGGAESIVLDTTRMPASVIIGSINAIGVTGGGVGPCVATSGVSAGGGGVATNLIQPSAVISYMIRAY